LIVVFVTLIGVSVIIAPRVQANSSSLSADLVGAARQLLVVSVDRKIDTVGRLSTYEMTNGVWARVLGPVEARVGRSGIKSNRREGDGSTPVGSFGLIGSFGWGKRALAKFPYRAVRRGDCWVSNSSQASYNRRINSATCGYPNEDLWRIARGGSYDMAVISDFNYERPIRGKGSAIFLHVHSYTKQGRSKPTSGCVSVVKSAMSKILEWLDSAKSPRIVITQRRDLPPGW
jgi:L,D-peptidoglycan transpeptidase YkuD (ErfK/YbiS/YcfS/YnhG family)